MRKIVVIVFLAVAINASAQIPNIKLKSADGELINIQDFKGEKLLVIDFWSVHCKPCLKAMPKLQEIYSELESEGMVLIGVNVDGPRNIAKVKPLKKAMGITYTTLLDSDKELMDALNVQVLPTMIAFNKKGRIVWFEEGFQPGDETKIKLKLKKILAKK